MVGGFYVKLYRACYHKISSVHIFILVSNLLYIPCSGLCGNFNDVLNDDPPRVGWLREMRWLLPTPGRPCTAVRMWSKPMTTPVTWVWAEVGLLLWCSLGTDCSRIPDCSRITCSRIPDCSRIIYYLGCIFNSIRTICFGLSILALMGEFIRPYIQYSHSLVS